MERSVRRGVEFVLYLLKLFLDNLTHQDLIRQDLFVVRDFLAQFFQFVFELMPFQAGKTTQAHFENSRRLGFGKIEALDQLRRSFLVGLGAANDGDDLVDVIERDKQAFQDMSALLGLAQVVARAADDNVLLVLDIVEQHLFERKRVGNAVHKSKHVDAPAHLELRVLVQLIEHNLRNGILLQFDDDIDRAVAVGAVMHVRDFRKLLFANEFSELLHQVRSVDLIGNLGDDDRTLPVLAFDNLMLCANSEASSSGFIRVNNSLATHDDAPGREVGAGENLHELFGGHVRVVEHQARSVDGLAEIVRGDIRRHADGDAVRSVNQEVRETRRQHLRLLQTLVVVRTPIHRFFLEIAQKLHGRLRQTRLGVTHSRGRVAVDASEVSVTVDQRNAHGEILGQTDHGVVHGRVAMGMVFADNVADRAGGFAVRTIRGDSAVVHRVQDTAMNRLEAVAHIGERTRHDNAH